MNEDNRVDGRSRRRVIEDELLRRYAIHELNMRKDMVCWQQRPYTHVTIAHNPAPLSDQPIIVHGFSKAKWPDPWDEFLGKWCAYKRAIRHLSEELVALEDWYRLYAVDEDEKSYSVASVTITNRAPAE